ncbi:MAG TPA: MetQ/NlpA family ABC transporter substrate-binding protein [Syntrophomonadaceae bacterium]|nr:MetQ/NlpA family ABC transporter substrate-binding protein [Syntrophomonadaceae bacterium]
MKKLIISLLLIVSSLTFLGCAQEQGTPVPEQKTIHIGVMPDVESIPFIIAEKNGYFEKENVQVKIEHFKSAQDRDSALQSGQLDGVVTDVLAVVFANEGGFELKIIAKNDGNIELMAGADAGINSMNDLLGKSVGLSTNTIMEYTVDKMLETKQLTSDDIKKQAIPQLPTRLEMLQEGKIDMAILPDPLASLAIKNGAKSLISTDQLGNKAGAIAFTKKTLRDNEEEVKAIFRAYNEAVEYLQNEPLADYIDFLIEKQGFPATVKDILELPEYTKAVEPNPEIIADVVQWMKAKELIKQDYKYEDLVDDKILR